MIVRGSASLKLAGRRRTVVPTGFWEGLAHLLATGFFYRMEEQEPLAAGEMALRVMERLNPAHGLRTLVIRADGVACDSLGPDRSSARRIAVKLGPAEVASTLPWTLDLGARSTHPRGRPALTLELTAIPLVPELADRPLSPDTPLDGEQKTRFVHLARALLENEARRTEFLAQGRIQAEALLADLLDHCRAALPVESVETEIALCFPGPSSDASALGQPVAVGFWLSALATQVAMTPALAEGLTPWSMDGGGGFDDAAPAIDGGGSFDAPAAGDVGGGGIQGP